MSDGSVTYSDAIYQSILSGLVDLADNVNKKITQKVWESDITALISNYDSSTTQTIRDRVSDVEQDLDGITSRVSATESSLQTKADNSTVTTLSNTVSQNKQAADSFQQTVTSTYAKLTDVDDKIAGLEISGDNLYIIANQTNGYINANGGSIAAMNQTYKERTSDYIPVIPGETYIIQSWCKPSATGESWLGY